MTLLPKALHPTIGRRINFTKRNLNIMESKKVLVDDDHYPNIGQLIDEPIEERIFNAFCLLDTPGDPSQHYATMVEQQLKLIETRMRDVIPEGDFVVCCSNGSMTRNKGLALCIVYASKGRPMTTEDEPKAKIGCVPGRIAYDLSNWRFFSRKFEFTKCRVDGTFQGKFRIRIPDDVQIIEINASIRR